MAATTGKITINVGGRKVPLRFALWALRNTCKTLGITLEQFLEKLESSENGGISIFEMLDFYAEAIKEAANYELDVDSIPYQTRHAYEWIEELEPTSEAFKSVVKCLIESIVFNLTGMTLEEAAKKAEANAALAAQIGTKKKAYGWEEIEFDGIGVLGLNPETFWGLTLHDFSIKMQAYRDKQEAWEKVIRLQTYWIVSPNIKPEEKVQPSDLWTLPSEMADKALENKKKEEQAEREFLRMLGL